jgi:hypothetical protein
MIIGGEIKATEGEIDAAVNLFKFSMDHAVPQLGNLADQTLACEHLDLDLCNREREDDLLWTINICKIAVPSTDNGVRSSRSTM